MKQLASTIGSMGLLVHLFTVGAHAQNTINEVVENNLTASGEPVCIGDDANYVAQISGPDYFSSAEWYFKWTGCDPAAQEVRMVNSNGDPLSGLIAIRQHDKLGSFSLRVRVRFAKATGGN